MAHHSNSFQLEDQHRRLPAGQLLLSKSSPSSSNGSAYIRSRRYLNSGDDADFLDTSVNFVLSLHTGLFPGKSVEFVRVLDDDPGLNF
jgi:hypothetical protein